MQPSWFIVSISAVAVVDENNDSPVFTICIFRSLSGNQKQKDISTVSDFIVTHIAITMFNTLAAPKGNPSLLQFSSTEGVECSCCMMGLLGKTLLIHF